MVLEAAILLPQGLGTKQDCCLLIEALSTWRTGFSIQGGKMGKHLKQANVIAKVDSAVGLKAKTLLAQAKAASSAARAEITPKQPGLNSSLESSEEELHESLQEEMAWRGNTLLSLQRVLIRI